MAENDRPATIGENVCRQVFFTYIKIVETVNAEEIADRIKNIS
jgi:hypothetical protein